jgi:hypothetical protein
MGKKAVYTEMPTKPKVAKIAWAKGLEYFKNPPDKLTYNSTTRIWSVWYKGWEMQFHEDDLKGV